MMLLTGSKEVKESLHFCDGNGRQDDGELIRLSFYVFVSLRDLKH